MFLGLRSVIYPAPDLAASRDWFVRTLGVEPYFDQPFYIGFAVGGYEVGLDPDADPSRGPTAYWGVADVDTALADLRENGATIDSEVRDVGDGIRLASVIEPGGGVFGVIENPHFTLDQGVTSPGPGL